MNILPLLTVPQAWHGDALAIAVFSSPKASHDPHEQSENSVKKALELSEVLKKLDIQVLGCTLTDLIAESEFLGESGVSVSGRVGIDYAIRKVILIGMGDPAQANADVWRKSAAIAVKWANKEKVKKLALSFPNYNQDVTVTAQAIAEGVLLAAHQDKRFKSKNTNPSFLEQVEILETDPDMASPAIAKAQQIVDGVILARELVSAPANIVTPITLADTAIAIAKESDFFTVKILEQADCEALGMGAFLGVARASDIPPKFIHLTYRHGEPKRKLAIVGKGLTFDSGGLNIKTGVGSSIELMKTDMGGSAAALGAAKAIAHLQPTNIEVHFIVASCENMVNGSAMRPGDILTASNGKTIEVNNTDAEGRLTLADALVYADRLGVDAIVDLATLTGACVVALGEDIGGMWSIDDSWAEAIAKAARDAGEKLWRMPLEAPYFDQLKSVVADFKNTGSRAGGAITGALFLKQFVETTKAWAHLDVAGPVWTERDSGYNNAGGTGFAVRTLVNLILN
ncbi:MULTISPECIES: leucyl aminopeptidase [Pseudanabaena]|uniref:Probable cytosol aminopeptidase n=2 Tax=Pseudanabaena TaxID=1152 RepID=L8N2I8_9CYAN|nr:MULTISPECIES: leucyl aminopeptidase [Pseudanabaena]ELS33911.1 cytosol aminopeptidase [Pseudanabaena biceps PCC 7429]MDG3493876.1 leucyl aminopeptidase [Pseudanabaena catenata USMAC16]